MANYPKIRIKENTLEKIRDIQESEGISSDSKTLQFLVTKYEEHITLLNKIKMNHLRQL